MTVRRIPDSAPSNALIRCKLERVLKATHLGEKRIVCPNSHRSTPGEARDLRDRLFAETDILWEVVEA